MRRLLAVDDSQEILKLRHAVFTAEGFEVVTCDSPRVALHLLQTSHFDLLITDYDMPCLNGLSLAKRARARGFIGPMLLATGTALSSKFTDPWFNKVVEKGQPIRALVDAAQDCIARSVGRISPAKEKISLEEFQQCVA